MIRHLPRTIFCLVMILVTATLVLNGCFSSDDTDPVIPEPARSPLAVVDLATVGGTGYR
jgi:hypothetical protein